jgi:hypothetical protein
MRTLLLRPRRQAVLALPASDRDCASDFGTGTSPTLADGIVILVRDELKDSRIYALSLETGKLLAAALVIADNTLNVRTGGRLYAFIARTPAK